MEVITTSRNALASGSFTVGNHASRTTTNLLYWKPGANALRLMVRFNLAYPQGATLSHFLSWSRRTSKSQTLSGFFIWTHFVSKVQTLSGLFSSSHLIEIPIQSGNLKYLRAFAAARPDRGIVQGSLAQITEHRQRMVQS